MNTTPADAFGAEPDWESDGEVTSASVMLVGATGLCQSGVERNGPPPADRREDPFEHLDALLSSSDLVVANLETAATPLRGTSSESEQACLRSDDPNTGPRHLLRHNIAAVTCADDHLMGRGEGALLDTLTALETHGIRYAGAGRSLERARHPLQLRLQFAGGTERGISIFAGAGTAGTAGTGTSAAADDLSGSFATSDTPGCNPLSVAELSDQIAQLRQERPGELVIVTPQWQRDHRWASEAQRSFARAAIRAGADLVIGHGGHVAQEIDIVSSRPVFHGIGSLLPTADGWPVPTTDGWSAEHDMPPFSAAVRLHLTAEDTQLRVYPLHTDEQATSVRSRPVTAEQFEQFYLSALAHTRSSAAFLRAIGTGHDAQGHFLEIPLSRRHRVRVNRHRRGTASTMTYWEQEPVRVRYDRRNSNNLYVLERELRTRAATFRRIDPGTIAGTSRAGEPYLLRTSVTHHTGRPGARAVKEKDLARRILQEAGASVPPGDHFRSADHFDRAASLMHGIGPVVVKPVDGNLGRGVTVGVNTVDHLRSAWTHAFSETTSGVLVEQQFEGDEFRISVVDGVACAVTKRVPPQITGDGVRTVRELINDQNDERQQHLVLHSKPLDLTGARLRRLVDAGLTPLSVLPEGKTHVIDQMGSVGSGAYPVHCIEEVDASYLRSAERAARAFHDLDIVGVDMLCTDASAPASFDNHIIIEVNSQPEVATHAAAPTPRAPRSFPALIVDSALAPPAVGPFRARRRRPKKPASPTSEQLLAAEFEARGMDITWWNEQYFHARAEGSTVSVWGSATDRTGGSSRNATRSRELSRSLLRHARLPVPTEGRAQRTATWPRIRFLVAHGRVLAALDAADPARRDALRGIHISHRAVAAAAARAFPGLDLAEVSLAMQDPHGPAVKKQTLVESVRAEPDLVEFVVAAGRRPRIIRTIVDLHLGGDRPAPEAEVTWASSPAPAESTGKSTTKSTAKSSTESTTESTAKSTAKSSTESSAESSAAGVRRRARKVAGIMRRRA